MKIISYINMPINQYGFKAKTYSERVQNRLRSSDWWDKNFGGDEERARNSAEREMLDEIDNNTSRKRRAENEYERYVDNYNYQSSRNTNRLNELDSEIQRERNLHISQESKIRSLNSRIAAQTDKVIESSKALDNITDKTNTTRDKVSSLKQESSKLKKEISDIKIQTETKIQEETEKIRKQSFEEYNQQVEVLTKKPLLYLNQNIILPLKIKQSGKDFTIPNGLLLETPAKLFSRTILSWITKKTNSNYAILNAKKYKTESDFFEALSDISDQARDNNKKTNRHTFTLVSNVEKFTQKENSQIIPYLKSFMDTTSRDYSNTIILSTKDSTKLDPILTAKHRFPLKMKLAWNFLFVREYGFRTMLSNLLKMNAERTRFKSKLSKQKPHKETVANNINSLPNNGSVDKSNKSNSLIINNATENSNTTTKISTINNKTINAIEIQSSRKPNIVKPTVENLELYFRELMKQDKPIVVKNLQEVVSSFSTVDVVNLFNLINKMNIIDIIIPIPNIDIIEENNNYYDDLVLFIKRQLGRSSKKEIIENINALIALLGNNLCNDKLSSYLENADFMKVIINSPILKKYLQ